MDRSSLDENPRPGNSAPHVLDPVAAGAAAADIAALPGPAPGVALWWCALDAPSPSPEALAALLSDAERARADRFGTAALRERYIVGRASLRRVLGATLGLAPADVPIVRGERGRPQLGEAASDGATELDFNISHSAGAAMIGIASDARIGVDIERRDRIVNVAGLARKFLTAAERAQLAGLDADAARCRVLELWTCKEAMSKATGDALSAPFAALTVDLAGGPRLCDGPAPYLPARWELRSAAAPEAFFATVALWRR